MNTEIHDSKSTKRHGSFERRDISTAGVVYFFVGLAAITIVIHFLLVGFYDFLDKSSNTQQAAVSPLVTNVPKDSRKLPPEYKGDYEKYLKENFPTPQLEIDDRTQLNQIRLNEEQLLNSYGWVDEQSKTVRIPIERAMDLVAQRGLPVRPDQAAVAPATAAKQKKGARR